MSFTVSNIKAAFGVASSACFSVSSAATEKNKTYRIINARQPIIKVHVDGCLIKGSSNRCDFVFIIESLQTVVFVELKSEDIDHAYVQIVKTIAHFNSVVSLRKEEIEGCIVSSSVPKHANLKFQTLIAKFKRDHGRSLTKHTNQCVRNC